MKNEFEVRGNDVVIFVKGYGQIFECIIDSEDFNEVDSIKNSWYVSKRRGMYYVYYQPTIDGKRRTVMLHQFLLETFGKKFEVVVDHIDGDTMNNRRKNIQVTSQLENVHKAKVMKTNKLGVKHVRFRSDRNKYQVQFERNRKNIHVGYFDTLDDAIQARDNYLKEVN